MPPPPASGSIPRPSTLTFITSNPHKLSEVRAILGDAVTLQSRALDLVEIQAASVEEIARDKCARAARMVSASGLLCFFLILFFLIGEADAVEKGGGGG